MILRLLQLLPESLLEWLGVAALVGLLCAGAFGCGWLEGRDGQREITAAVTRQLEQTQRALALSRGQATDLADALAASQDNGADLMRRLLPLSEWRTLRRGLWWMLAVPTLLALLALAAGCAPAAPDPAPVALPLQPVPRPQRPAFVAFEDGDFLPCSAEARRRLLQRHAQVVWYVRELETALDAWEAQTKEARP